MRGFFGIAVMLLLISIIISASMLHEQSTSEFLESKQRMIEYQEIEQQRTELFSDFEKSASLAAKQINSGMKSSEALSVFCVAMLKYLKPYECASLFWVDVYQKRAVLKNDFVPEKENYNVVFQKGGYFE